MTEIPRTIESKYFGEALRTSEFFDHAFAQVRERPLNARYFRGSHLAPYVEIWNAHKSKLEELDSSVSMQTLRYIKPSVKIELMEQMTAGTYSEIVKVKASHDEATDELIESTILPKLRSQELKSGTLSNPPTYSRQEYGRTCYTANFRMIFTAITGREVTDQIILDSAKKNNLLILNSPTARTIQPYTGNSGYHDVEENNLLAVFQTPAFKEEFPNTQVGIIKLTGASFNDIEQLTNRLKVRAERKNLTFDAYCIAMLKSEVIKTGWHNSILLSADEKNTTVHDPSGHQTERGYLLGGENKQIEKDHFIRRWGYAHLRGDYIFSLKS